MNGTPVKRGSSAGIAAVAGLALALGAACGSSDKAGPHDRAQLARIVTHSESKLLGFRDVDQLLAAGKIKNKGLANSLQAKLRAAAAARARAVQHRGQHLRGVHQRARCAGREGHRRRRRRPPDDRRPVPPRPLPLAGSPAHHPLPTAAGAEGPVSQDDEFEGPRKGSPRPGSGILPAHLTPEPGVPAPCRGW